MYDQQAFEQLKSFFENKSVSQEAAAPLSSKVEIGIIINQHNECVFHKDKSGHARFEKRAAVNPDVIFYLSPEAIESLVNGPHATIGEVGIDQTTVINNGNVIT